MLDPLEVTVAKFSLKSSPPSHQFDMDEVVLTLLEFLQQQSQWQIDIEGLDPSRGRDTFTHWHNHVVGRTDYDRNERDWKGLRQFYGKFRREEVESVHQHVRATRSLVWQSLRQAAGHFRDHQNFNLKLQNQITRLKQAAQGQSLQKLQQAALEVALTLENLISDQKEQATSRIQDYQNHVTRLQTELNTMKSQLEIDHLTGLYNRGAFDIQIDRVAALATLMQRPATLILFDLDHFKGINDQYGHLVGDAVLKNFGTILTKAFPRKGDFCARYGGEEFAVILSEDGQDIAHNLLGKCLNLVRQSDLGKEGVPLKVTVSAGYCSWNNKKPPLAVPTWIQAADQALYRAKRAGRNCFVDADA